MRDVKTILAAAAVISLIGCDAAEQQSRPKVSVSPQEATEAKAKLEQMEVEVGDAALLRYAEKGDTETVLLLLKSGVPPNAQHLSGATALMVAANYGKLETANALIEFGADLDAQDLQGDTALIRAASLGHADLARLLIEAGANVDLKGQRGRSPLMQAVVAGNNGIVGLLVKAGADQVPKDNEGNTVRDLADKYNNPDALAILDARR